MHLVHLPCAHQVGGYSSILVHRLVHRLVRRLVQLWLMYFASAGTLCKGLVCLGFALCRPCATRKSSPWLFLASPNRPKLQQIEPVVCTSSRANGRTRRAQAPAQGKSIGKNLVWPCAGWDLPNLVHLGFSSFGLVQPCARLVRDFFLIDFFSIQYSNNNGNHMKIGLIRYKQYTSKG